MCTYVLKVPLTGENGQVADTDVILEALFLLSCSPPPRPPLGKRCLSSRNPDTAYRDQNVAFFLVVSFRDAAWDLTQLCKLHNLMILL